MTLQEWGVSHSYWGWLGCASKTKEQLQIQRSLENHHPKDDAQLINFTEETDVQQNEKEQTTTSLSKSSVTLLASYSMCHREVHPINIWAMFPLLNSYIISNRNTFLSLDTKHRIFSTQIPLYYKGFSHLGTLQLILELFLLKLPATLSSNSCKWRPGLNIFQDSRLHHFKHKRSQDRENTCNIT